jgi:hypothetical protein
MDMDPLNNPLEAEYWQFFQALAAVAYPGDVVRIREVHSEWPSRFPSRCPPLVSLHSWANGVGAAFKTLWQELEHGTIRAYRRVGPNGPYPKIDPREWRDARQAAIRQGPPPVLPFYDPGMPHHDFFIIFVWTAPVLRDVVVFIADVLELFPVKQCEEPAPTAGRSGFAERLARVSKEMRPVGQLPVKIERKLEKRRDAHSHPRPGPKREALLAETGKASLAPPAKLDRPKKLAPAQHKALAAHIRRKARTPGAPTERGGWQVVANEYVGRPVLREDVRAAIEEADAKGKSGRPRKSGR